MNLKVIISRNFGARPGLSNFLSSRAYATDAKSEKTNSGVLEYDEVPVFKKPEESEEYIDRIRNKSRLAPQDLKRLKGEKPYESSQEWYHNTVKYKKKILGRYGLKSLDVPAGIAWPTIEEVEDIKEYEKVAYPHSLQETWKILENERIAEEEKTRFREEMIDQKLQNMAKWKADLQKKIDQKEAAERAAREKREEMIEEIRRKFGVNVNPKSAKFKELVDKKREEDKKLKKEMKKKEKEAKMLSSIKYQLDLAESAIKAAEAEKSAKKEKSEASSKETANDSKPDKPNDA